MVVKNKGNPGYKKIKFRNYRKNKKQGLCDVGICANLRIQ